MFPSFVMNKVENSVVGKLAFAGYCGGCFALSRFAAHFQNLGRDQLCKMFWILCRPCLFAKGTAALCHHVTNILDIRSQKQMFRIATMPHIASVANEIWAGINAVMKEIRDPRNDVILAFLNAGQTVARLFCYVGLPRPTIIRTSFGNFRPEFIDLLLGKNGNATIPISHLISPVKLNRSGSFGCYSIRSGRFLF
jgi:hypothetical protein